MRKVTLSGLVARVTLERFVRISIADELLALRSRNDSLTGSMTSLVK